MKLNIINNERNARNGYLNVLDHVADMALVPGAAKAPDDTLIATNTEFAVVVSYDHFGDTILPCEVDEQIMVDVVDFIEPLQVDKHIAYWCSLLASDAVISITGTDLLQVVDATSLARLSVQEANTLLYDGRKASYTAALIQSSLSDNSVGIERIILDNYKYTVIGRKN